MSLLDSAPSPNPSPLPLPAATVRSADELATLLNADRASWVGVQQERGHHRGVVGESSPGTDTWSTGLPCCFTRSASPGFIDQCDPARQAFDATVVMGETWSVIDDVTSAHPAGLLGGRTRRGLLVIGVGLATGALTLVGQALLDGDWQRIANSGAIWLAVAFGIGTVMVSDGEAAVAGIATLLLALLGYQLAAWAAHVSLGASGALIWSGTAVVGGPVYGFAGRRWRADGGRARILAIALLGAVFIAEGAYTLISIPLLAPAGWAEVLVGLAVPFLLGPDRRERLSGLVVLAPLSLLGLVAYEAISQLFLVI